MFVNPPIISIKLGFWGHACQWIGSRPLTKIEASCTPVPTMVMKEAVKMQSRDTNAQRDSLPHSREYEI